MLATILFLLVIVNGGGAWPLMLAAGSPSSWRSETFRVHLPRLSRYAGMRLIHTPEWLETLTRRGDSHHYYHYHHLNATSMRAKEDGTDPPPCQEGERGEPPLHGQWIKIAHTCRPFRALDKAHCVDTVLLINRILRVRMRLISEHPARIHVHCMTYDGRHMLASYTIEVRRGLTLEVHAEYPARFMSRFTRHLVRSIQREGESPTPPFGYRGEPNLILFRQIVFGFGR